MTILGLISVGMILGPADAAADGPPGLTVETRSSRSALEIRVVPGAGGHLSDEFDTQLVVRTSPESDLDETVELAGRTGELIAGYTVELPGVWPVVVDVELVLGICDDAGVCRPRHVGFQIAPKKRGQSGWSAAELMNVKAIKRSRAMAGITLAEAAAKGPGRGWYRDDLEAALTQATERKVPLLALFKTSWCPPCRRLQAEVLADPAYRARLSGFARVVFDADMPASWEAKSRYKVGGYPTIVVASSDGQLVWRQEGYENAEQFVQALEAAASQVATLEALDQAATADSPDGAAILAMAERYRHLKDAGEAAAWLERLPAGTSVDAATLARVRVFVATQDDDATAGAAALEEILLQQALEPSVPSSEQMWWWLELAGMQEGLEDPELAEGAPASYGRARSTAEHVIAEPATGARAFEAWQVVAEAIAALEGEEASVPAWSSACDACWGALGSTRPEPAVIRDNPGLVMSLVSALIYAERLEEARWLADQGIDAFPKESTMFQVRARLHERTSEDPAAGLTDAATAYKLARGDNRLRAAQLWSRLLVSAGRPDEAREVIREALAEVTLPADPDIRTHRYVGKLQQTLEHLSEPDQGPDSAEP